MHRQATYQPVTSPTAAPVTTSSPLPGTKQGRLAEDANRAHAQLRPPGERANAQLKTWHILRKLRCPGAPDSRPKPSTSFRPTRSQDEKGSVGRRCGRPGARPSPGSSGRNRSRHRSGAICLSANAQRHVDLPRYARAAREGSMIADAVRYMSVDCGKQPNPQGHRGTTKARSTAARTGENPQATGRFRW